MLAGIIQWANTVVYPWLRLVRVHTRGIIDYDKERERERYVQQMVMCE